MRRADGHRAHVGAAAPDAVRRRSVRASARVIRRLRALCDNHCPGQYDLAVIDIYQEPAIVFSRGIVAVPTLVREWPLPVRFLVGDLADEDRVVRALGLPWTDDD